MADQLFVSYSRLDSTIVSSLIAELRELGYDPFFDSELIGGQRWWDTILDRIQACEIFLPVVSTNYIDSEACYRETAWAAALGVGFLPIDIGGVDPQMCPRPIADANWVRYDLADRTSLARLSHALRSIQPGPRPEVIPERPAIPMTYFGELEREIAGQLSWERQLVIIATLRGRLGTREDATARRLLADLQHNEFISLASWREIDALLQTPARSQEVPFGTFAHEAGRTSEPVETLSPPEPVPAPSEPIAEPADLPAPEPDDPEPDDPEPDDPEPDDGKDDTLAAPPDAPASPVRLPRPAPDDPVAPAARPPRRKLPLVAAAAVLVVTASLVAWLVGRDDGGAAAQRVSGPSKSPSSSPSVTVSTLATGRVAATADAGAPAASTRVAMAGRRAGVRVKAMGEVDQLGTGADARVAKDGARLVGFTLADGPCQDGGCRHWTSLGLRIGVGDRPLRPLPDGGPSFVVAAGEEEDVQLVYQEAGLEQRVSLVTGAAVGENIEVLLRPRHEPRLPVRNRLMQVSSTTFSGLDRLVRLDGAQLYFFEPDIPGVHPERSDSAYLHLNLSYVNVDADSCAPPVGCGFTEGVVKFKTEGGSCTARNISPDPDVSRLVCEVPADVERGTLVIEGSEQLKSKFGQDYTAHLQRTTFPIYFSGWWPPEPASH